MSKQGDVSTSSSSSSRSATATSDTGSVGRQCGNKNCPKDGKHLCSGYY